MTTAEIVHFIFMLLCIVLAFAFGHVHGYVSHMREAGGKAKPTWMSHAIFRSLCFIFRVKLPQRRKP